MIRAPKACVAYSHNFRVFSNDTLYEVSENEETYFRAQYSGKYSGKNFLHKDESVYIQLRAKGIVKTRRLS